MKSIKQNPVASFIIVTCVYILAAAVGIAVYLVLPLPWWLSLLIADASAPAVTFLFSLLFGNASVYDPYWSVQPIVILAALSIGRPLTTVHILLLIAVIFWGVRLTANWAYMFGDLTHQDWRYTKLQETTGVFYPFVNFTGIHMVPTLIVYACTLPAVYAFLHNGACNVATIVCFCLSVCSVIMQGTADCQMHRYRKERTGEFIRDGLWRYSRHPNYLGEILMWWGVALSVIAIFPNAWYLAAGAFGNTLLFLIVSIPLADGRQSCKTGFEEYKCQTRMLLPIRK